MPTLVASSPQWRSLDLQRATVARCLVTICIQEAGFTCFGGKIQNSSSKLIAWEIEDRFQTHLHERVGNVDDVHAVEDRGYDCVPKT